MRHCISIAAAAILLGTSLVHAGGTGVMRTSYREATGSRVRTTMVSYGTASRGCGCGAAPCDAPSCGAIPCQSACSSCKPCCPRLLPLLIGKLDCLLQNAFYDPCNVPCCRTRTSRPTCCSDAWFSYAPNCGCGSGSAGGNWSPANEPIPATNPFIDDDLQMPPQVPKEARLKRASPSYRSAPVRQATYSSEPSTIPPVRVAEVAKIEDVPTTKVAASIGSKTNRPLQQVKHETVSGRTIPKNPLRGE
jgi:hypothetical protein